MTPKESLDYVSYELVIFILVPQAGFPSVASQTHKNEASGKSRRDMLIRVFAP